MGIFDTIWRRRGRPANRKAPVSLPPRKHITMTDRNYSELLEYGDVAIKFWLPDMVGIMLSQSCRFANTTRSDFIRQNLFIYLYGRYDLMGLLEQRDQYYRLDPPSRTLYSKSATPKGDLIAEPEPDIMQDLGKNIEDLKVWIPRKMKEDIRTLADKAAISLSEMIREIIISMLFGHTYLSTRKELMQMEIEVEKDGGFDSKGEGVD